jgi:hypothetical protein
MMGVCSKVDLLFVIDDSGSMEEEQKNLLSNFPTFIGLIDNYATSAGSLLDWRVGVTTTGRDLTYSIQLPPPFNQTTPPMTEHGNNGKLLHPKDCGVQNAWIERHDTFDKGKAFDCIADVGTSGPGIEMPLETMTMAFRERVQDGTNAGFLRDDALLAVVILTDENDCSRSDNNFTIQATSDVCDEKDPHINKVDSYVSFLDTLKGDRGRWASAVVAAPGPGSCKSAFGSAAEATRLKEFVNLAGQNSVFSSICDGDLTKALGDALKTFTGACENFTIP